MRDTSNCPWSSRLVSKPSREAARRISPLPDAKRAQGTLTRINPLLRDDDAAVSSFCQRMEARAGDEHLSMWLCTSE
jgi:hypothetical protein